MIKRLGDKKWLIDFQPSRKAPRLRRTIVGPRALAEEILLDLRKRALGGKFGWPHQSTATIKDLCDLVVKDYILNKRKSLHSAKQIRRFWVDQFGGREAESITGRLLNDLASVWVKGGLSSGRVNRRIAYLMRGYRLALNTDPPLLTRIPVWTRLKEAPPRSGTWSWENFLRVRSALPPHARPFVTICYWTGMRSGEVFSLTWPQIHFSSLDQLVSIELHGKDTKTSESRRIVMGGDLYQVLKEWLEATISSYPNCTRVCHYKGRAVQSIKSSWRNACVKVGLATWENPDGRYVGNRRYRGPLIHDFRRTGVTNMEDAGIPRKIAMSISGHKTDAVYRRYHIVKNEDLVDAARRLLQRHQEKTSRQSVDTVNE